MPFPIIPNNIKTQIEKDPYKNTININTLNYTSDSRSSQLFDTIMGSNVSDQEAQILFEIWSAKDVSLSEANKYLGQNEDVYHIPKKLRNNSNITRLKSHGFIDGGEHTVKFTNKGREIIKNIILFGEDSSFKDGDSLPKYSEIQKIIKETTQEKGGKKNSHQR